MQTGLRIGLPESHHDKETSDAILPVQLPAQHGIALGIVVFVPQTAVFAQLLHCIPTTMVSAGGVQKADLGYCGKIGTAIRRTQHGKTLVTADPERVVLSLVADLGIHKQIEPQLFLGRCEILQLHTHQHGIARWIATDLFRQTVAPGGTGRDDAIGRNTFGEVLHRVLYGTTLVREIPVSIGDEETYGPRVGLIHVRVVDFVDTPGAQGKETRLSMQAAAPTAVLLLALQRGAVPDRPDCSTRFGGYVVFCFSTMGGRIGYLFFSYSVEHRVGARPLSRRLTRRGHIHVKIRSPRCRRPDVTGEGPRHLYSMKRKMDIADQKGLKPQWPLQEWEARQPPQHRTTPTTRFHLC